MRQCEDILKITGLHEFIAEDGDGDWAAVWENAYDLPTVAAWAEHKAEVARLREKVARVEVLHSDAGRSQGYFGDGYSEHDHCCATCGSLGEYGVEWPCATVKAIRGDS